MTNAQIEAMLRDEEKSRRRERFQRGIGPAQHGKRIGSKKGFRKGSRKLWKLEVR